MQSNGVHDSWAASNLETIRRLMERSALYRRALAPVCHLAAFLGFASAALGWFARWDTPRAFAGWWLATAVVVLGLALVIMRRQALRDGETFWSPPTRRVAQAMSPALFAGLVAGLLVAVPAWREPLHAWWLPGIWMVLFGCAAHAAGFFMPRGMKVFGWMFALVGAVFLVYLNARSHAAGMPSLRLAHLVMGAVFGGLHLVYGIYLSLTERRDA